MDYEYAESLFSENESAESLFLDGKILSHYFGTGQILSHYLSTVARCAESVGSMGGADSSTPPRSTICVGGPHITHHPGHLLKTPAAGHRRSPKHMLWFLEICGTFYSVENSRGSLALMIYGFYII